MGLHALIAGQQRGITTMTSITTDGIQSDFESELIDLGAVSLSRLRALDSTMLRQSLSQVVEQTSCSGKIRAACSSADQF